MSIKKILQVNSVLNTGSTGRIAENIGQLIIDRGWESYIAYGRYGNPSQSKTVKIGNKWDNYFHAVYTRITDRHGFASTNATKKFIEVIENVNPDILHLHNIHGYYLNIEILFSYLKTKNIPIIWTLHDCWAFTGHCTHFTYQNCYKWQIECNNCPVSNLYPSSFNDNSRLNFRDKLRLFNSVDNITIVTVSDWLSKEINLSFLKDKPLKVIKNGIDIKRFVYTQNPELRLKYHLNNSFIILGVAAIWDDRKGLADFIKFSETLKKDEKMILIGLNKKQIKKLPKHIIGLERTESIEELVSFYSEANVFLNLTLEDNYPTTNLESISCGTPVITYNTGGSVEAVDSKTGFVVNQKDFIGLRYNIDIIKKNGKMYYMNACRDRAIKKFDKNDKFKEYIDLYSSLLML